jgi:NitT/TauT family transport system ATP-binding protein
MSEPLSSNQKANSFEHGSLLEVTDLAKGYGVGSALPVLGGLSFSARQGEFLSIVGPSGCGKTTLLLALSGLLAPDSGNVTFKNAIVSGGTPKGMAIVFQDYSRSLFPWKTVMENVAFGMRRTADRSSRRARAAELLDSVGLNSFGSHYPWQLSGGMQQRVAIARGLASESELLLLDEPLAAVDAQTRADVQDLLLHVAQRFGQTCVLVTHDVDEAVYMADRVVVLSNRPTRVIEIVDVDLPKPRDQVETKEQRRFLEIRHQVLSQVRKMRGMVSEPVGGGTK